MSSPLILLRTCFGGWEISASLIVSTIIRGSTSVDTNGLLPGIGRAVPASQRGSTYQAWCLRLRGMTRASFSLSTYRSSTSDTLREGSTTCRNQLARLKREEACASLRAVLFGIRLHRCIGLPRFNADCGQVRAMQSVKQATFDEYASRPMRSICTPAWPAPPALAVHRPFATLPRSGPSHRRCGSMIPPVTRSFRHSTSWLFPFVARADLEGTTL